MKKFIAIFLIVVAGFGGYFGWAAYNKHHQTNNPSQQIVNSDRLVIAEWGVQIPINNEIQNLQYVMSQDKNYITVSTPELKKLSQDHPSCNSNGEFAVMSRAKPGDDHFGSPWTEEQLKEVGEKLGSYYYLVQTNKYYCTNEGTIPNEVSGPLEKTRARFLDSADKIQLAT